MPMPKYVVLLLIFLASPVFAATPRLVPVADPTQRLEFEGFSILPPQTKGWVLVEPPIQVEPNLTARVYFIKSLTGEGASSGSELHRLTAVVRTFNVEAAKTGTPTEILKSMGTGMSGEVALGKCFGRDCLRYQSTTELRDNPTYPGRVFLLNKTGYFVLHPESTAFVINVEYRQYHSRGAKPLSQAALEAEVEPFQTSLQFTAVRR